MKKINSKINAIIFDMDGLMFDTESQFSFAQSEVLKRYNRTFTLKIQNKMMGRKPLDAIKIMVEELNINEDPLKIANERDEVYIKLIQKQSQPMPGLLEFLDKLNKHKIRKAIASGSYKSWINILLMRFNIQNQFEVIVSGEDVIEAKPNPEIYIRAVHNLQLPASSCVALEDSVNGILSAKSAGCYTVAIPNKFTEKQDFSAADYVVSSLIDPKLIKLLAL